MVKLKTAINLCLKTYILLDKKSNSLRFIYQKMINNINSKHRFGAAFHCPFFLSVTAPNLCLLFIQQKGENTHD